MPLRPGPAQQLDRLVGTRGQVLANQRRVRQRQRVPAVRRPREHGRRLRQVVPEHGQHLREHGGADRGDRQVGMLGGGLVAGQALLPAEPLVGEDRGQHGVRLLARLAQQVQQERRVQPLGHVVALGHVRQQLVGLLPVALPQLQLGQRHHGPRRLGGRLGVDGSAQQPPGLAQVSLAQPGQAVVDVLERLLRDGVGQRLLPGGVLEQQRGLEGGVGVLAGRGQPGQLHDLVAYLLMSVVQHAEQRDADRGPLVLAGLQHGAQLGQCLGALARLGVHLGQAGVRLDGVLALAAGDHPVEDRLGLGHVAELRGRLGQLDQRGQPELGPGVLGGHPVGGGGLGVLAQIHQHRAEQAVGHGQVIGMADGDGVLAHLAGRAELPFVGVRLVELERRQRHHLRVAAGQQRPVVVLGLGHLVQVPGRGRVLLEVRQLQPGGQLRHGRAVTPAGPLQRLLRARLVAELREHEHEGGVRERGHLEIRPVGGDHQHPVRRRPLLGRHEHHAHGDGRTLPEHGVARLDHRPVRRLRTLQVPLLHQQPGQQMGRLRVTRGRDLPEQHGGLVEVSRFPVAHGRVKLLRRHHSLQGHPTM